MAITPLPALDRTSPTFKTDVDTFFGAQIPVFVTEANALQADVNAKQVTASDAAATATEKAADAAQSLTDATEQAGIALGHANTAGTHAGTSTTQADSAITQAGIAADRAGDALTQANRAEGEADRAELEADRSRDEADRAETAAATIAGGPITSLTVHSGVKTGAVTLGLSDMGAMASTAEMQDGTVTDPRLMAPASVLAAILANSRLQRVARTANTQLAAADSGKLIDITSGTFTQTFAAAAALGNGWYCYIKNSGTGNVTLDPNASETIDGLATLAAHPGFTVLIQCDAAALRTVLLAGEQVFMAADEKPSNTPPSEPPVGAWGVRELNTIRKASIQGASLSGNVITLPAGTYRVIARCPAYRSGQNKARLYSITSGQTLIAGSSENSNTTSSCASVVDGVISLAGAETVRLDHFTAVANLEGFGARASSSLPEVYAQITIRKIA